MDRLSVKWNNRQTERHPTLRQPDIEPPTCLCSVVVDGSGWHERETPVVIHQGLLPVSCSEGLQQSHLMTTTAEQTNVMAGVVFIQLTQHRHHSQLSTLTYSYKTYYYEECITIEFACWSQAQYGHGCIM